MCSRMFVRVSQRSCGLVVNVTKIKTISFQITFTQAQDLLERMLKSLTQAISGPGPEHDVVAKRELTSLLKELLRVSFKADHPRILTQVSNCRGHEKTLFVCSST